MVGENMPLISVIIPVYNAETHLKKCLDSVAKQTLSDIEIICVNDGSTDGSAEILQKFAEKDKRFIIITQKNQGLSVARNVGLARSSAKSTRRTVYTGRSSPGLDSDRPAPRSTRS